MERKYDAQIKVVFETIRELMAPHRLPTTPKKKIGFQPNVDFMFQLTQGEKIELVTKCDRFQKLKHSTVLPRAFTEQGVAMLSTVLNSDRAIEVNIQIMRAFVKLREMIASHKDLARKLDALEKKYDDNFKVVFDAIRALMTPSPEKPKKKIGFGLREKQAGYGKKK